MGRSLWSNTCAFTGCTSPTRIPDFHWKIQQLVSTIVIFFKDFDFSINILVFKLTVPSQSMKRIVIEAKLSVVHGLLGESLRKLPLPCTGIPEEYFIQDFVMAWYSTCSIKVFMVPLPMTLSHPWLCISLNWLSPIHKKTFLAKRLLSLNPGSWSMNLLTWCLTLGTPQISSRLTWGTLSLPSFHILQRMRIQGEDSILLVEMALLPFHKAWKLIVSPMMKFHPPAQVPF